MPEARRDLLSAWLKDPAALWAGRRSIYLLTEWPWTLPTLGSRGTGPCRQVAGKQRRGAAPSLCPFRPLKPRRLFRTHSDSTICPRLWSQPVPVDPSSEVAAGPQRSVPRGCGSRGVGASTPQPGRPTPWCHLLTMAASHPQTMETVWRRGLHRDRLLCPHRQYYWYDERGKKVKCTAPQYVDFVMSSVQKLVTDEDVFPTKYGRSPVWRWGQLAPGKEGGPTHPGGNLGAPPEQPPRPLQWAGGAWQGLQALLSFQGPLAWLAGRTVCPHSVGHIEGSP